MFTLDQIKTAHAKVRSGVDFPAYIQEIKALGVIAYEHFVSDGHIQYFGENNFSISNEAKWARLDVASTGLNEILKTALLVHQQGQTDYPTFCRQSAEAGVEKWVVDINRMTCIYMDLSGNEMLVETIPAAD